MAEPAIHILMATYDGARFLRAQLDSLVAQQDADWVLWVRDDGSRDGTRAILAEAAVRDARIRIVGDARGRLGSAGSFFALMELARREGAARFALCDQDDVWRADKLARLRAELDCIETRCGAEMPALVWSDLAWIGADGAALGASHFRGAGLAEALHGAGFWLLAMNAVPGCAMLGNAALLEHALPRPPGVVHHDWWLALVAAACGRVGVVSEPLLAYRQHEANQIGARALSQRMLGALRSPSAALASGRRVYWQAVAQARALQAQAAAAMHEDWAAACRATVQGLGARSAPRRMRAALCGPVRRIGGLRNLLLLAVAAAPPLPDSLLE